MNKLKVVDLFCGCGGFSSGLTSAGLEVLAGIDYWNAAINTYKNNFNHIALHKDLKKYPPLDFEKDTNIKQIDVLVFSPPCQGYSSAGKRDKNDPRNFLFTESIKYLNHYKPRAFLMENVAGILSMKTKDNTKVIDTIMEHLTKDYNCKYYKLSAADFEVPQNRKRVIFIGFRKNTNIEPTPPDIVSNKHIPVKTILEKRDDVDNSYFLSKKAIDGINTKKEKMKAKKHGFGAQFLDPEKPSYTIPARYWKDGYDALVKYSDTDIRRLTINELKKIQSFPDNFQFVGNKKDIITQIGNAVASRFAYHLGKYLINKLNPPVVPQEIIIPENIPVKKRKTITVKGGKK
jgi:DNA (cytosine-5)-methyltransferase 1